jgi:HlyD family secretion protein
MRTSAIHDLSHCTEYYQSLQARPPRITHGTALLLTTLLGGALLWAALTKANLVVKAPGRIRPANLPTKVVYNGAGESSNAGSGGRVVHVNYREGDVVAKGAILLQLDTERLDNEIMKKKRAIQAGEEELAKLAESYKLLCRQHMVARAKAEAELSQGLEEVRQEKLKRASDLRQTESDYEAARYKEEQLQQLVRTNAAAHLELVEARAKTRESLEKRTKAKLPVDESKLVVLRRAVELTDRDYDLKKKEAVIKQDNRRKELKADQVDLANLELERKQAILMAPIAGVVTMGDVKVGDVLERGKTVMEIAEQDGFLFEAEVSNEDVGDLKAGMRARIKLDAFDYQRYGTLEGVVQFVSPDSGVKDNAASQQQQQRLTYVVKIDLDGCEIGRGEYRGRAKLGMSGQVEIITAEESLLSVFVRKIRKTIRLD